jgi:hypothetical protein
MNKKNLIEYMIEIDLTPQQQDILLKFLETEKKIHLPAVWIVSYQNSIKFYNKKTMKYNYRCEDKTPLAVWNTNKQADDHRSYLIEYWNYRHNNNYKANLQNLFVVDKAFFKPNRHVKELNKFLTTKNKENENE